MSFIYVSAPYFDESATQRNHNYTKISYYLTSLLLKRQFAYNPAAAHHHLIAEFDLGAAAKDWMAHCFAILASAKELHVLTLANWPDNAMVLAEINFWRASRQGSPIYYVDWSALTKARNSKRLSNASRSALQSVPAPKVG